MSGDFLARWSRRKLDARREPEELPPENPPEPTAAPAEEGEPELTPEELESLPPVEELTAESDFGLFLRKGVPEKLKNAALRRMWSLDPAIRDHVGDARDYAYDWNVAGGVPGNGPLLPTDNVEDVLRGIFADADRPDERQVAGVEAPEPVRRGPSSQTDQQESTAASDEAAEGKVLSEEEAAIDPEHPALAGPREFLGAEALTQENQAIVPLRSDSTTKGPSEETLSRDVSVRRHGGAKPV